jgi:cytochrome c biogenesis protein CcmG, thiol:disulfide interchange protein DsbE
VARFLLPLSIFIVLAGFLAYGLQLNPREVPSPLIDKPAPPFKVAQLHPADKTISPEDMKGKVWLLNVWASWCVSCRQEHPLLVEFAKRNLVPVVGLNYKEVRADGGIDTRNMSPEAEMTLARERAKVWLAQHGGDPYFASAMDLEGRIGIDYGVYGVPETFLIDKAGIIRYKHIGPLTQSAIEQKIIPKIKELSGA